MSWFRDLLVMPPKNEGEEDERTIHQYEARAEFANGRSQYYNFNKIEQYSHSIVLYRYFDSDGEENTLQPKVEGIISMRNLNDFYMVDRDETPLRELVDEWVNDTEDKQTSE